MDTKTRILYWVGAASFVVGVLATFYLFILKGDFYISVSAPCDPETESCYYWVCKPDYWFDCTGDPEEDIFIYKIVRKKASELSSCDPVVEQSGFFSKLIDEKECPPPTCEEGGDCETIYCGSSDPKEVEECYSDDLYDSLVEEISQYKTAADIKTEE